MRFDLLSARVGLLLGVLILGFIGLFGLADPAIAATCRNTGAHQICILSIKRSAKNAWEYRVAVRIDAVTRPVEVYNCRDRRRIRQDGNVVPFQPDGAGEVICSFFKR